MFDIRKWFVESFAFYAAYHQHPVNQIIHIITIPVIMFTILVIASYINFYNFEIVRYEIINAMLNVNAGLILITFYTIMYIMLDVLGGILFFPCVMILYILSNVFRYLVVGDAWIISIMIHIVAWIIQFAGHVIWEKRKPALFDSIIQAFLMAPFFIFMEILFMCGYKKKFQEEINCLKIAHLETIQLIV
jgi:uncharacterized membrane protein YGL010W